MGESTETKKAARAKIEVEGEVPKETVENVIDAAAGKDKAEKRKGEPTPTKFERAIRDLSNRIVATRVQPTTMDDGTVLGDEYELRTHENLTESEIKQDIAQARGGRKWHVRVLDPDDNVVSAKMLLVPGEPKLDPMMASLDPSIPPITPVGRRGAMEPFSPAVDPGEEIAQKIAQDPDIINREKELRLLELQQRKEEKEAELAEARARRAEAERRAKGEHQGNGSPNLEEKLAKAIADATAPLKEQNQALQKALEEERRLRSERDIKIDTQRMIESATAPIKAVLDTIQAKLQAPASSGPSMTDILAKLDAVKAEIKLETERQINSTLQALTSKYDAQFQNIITQLSNIANRHGHGGDYVAREAVGALRDIATKGPGGAPADPFTMVEKTISLVKNVGSLTGTLGTATPTDFPSFLVEKLTSLAPDVMNFIESRQREGAAVTKEMVENRMKELGLKMWQELDATVKREIQSGFQRLAQARQVHQVQPVSGAPTSATVVPPAAQTRPMGPPPPGIVQSVQTPSSASPAPAPVAFQGASTQTPQTQPAPITTPAPSAAPPAATNPLQDQYRKRVNAVLKMIHHEIQLGVQGMQWPQKAFEWLPKDILDRIVAAGTDSELYEIVKPWGDPALMEAIWAYLRETNPQHAWYREWMSNGINWLKEACGAAPVEEPVVEDEGPPGP